MDPRFFLPCFHGPRASRLGHKRKEKTRSITCRTDRANEANKRYLRYGITLDNIYYGMHVTLDNIYCVLHITLDNIYYGMYFTVDNIYHGVHIALDNIYYGVHIALDNIYYGMHIALDNIYYGVHIALDNIYYGMHTTLDNIYYGVHIALDNIYYGLYISDNMNYGMYISENKAIVFIHHNFKTSVLNTEQIPIPSPYQVWGLIAKQYLRNSSFFKKLVFNTKMTSAITLLLLPSVQFGLLDFAAQQ